MKTVQNKTVMLILNIGCVLAILLVIFPLLLIAQYNYPSADDWSYGSYTYQVIQRGGNFLEVLQAALQVAVESYKGWDGRFANGFLDALQPGIWGEKYYALTPWILIGTLMISEMLFWHFIVYKRSKNEENILLWLPIAVPPFLIQILYTPSTEQSLYWYCGGMNYTFVYSISLILLLLFVRVAEDEHLEKKTFLIRRRIWAGGAACILAVFVGGGNFSTSLSTVLAMCAITAVFLIKKEYAFVRKNWLILLMTAACLAICLLSPGSAKGNAARIANMGSALYSVKRSLIVSAQNIYSWTLKKEIWFMLFFIAPFIWKAVKNVKYSFRYPLLFSLSTFLVYASQVMPNIYTSGSTGGGRNVGVYYYSYVIWIAGNLFYWLGYLRKKSGWSIAKAGNNHVLLLIYCSVVTVSFAAYLYVVDKKNISSYKAYRDWKQGWAQQYAKEWDARLEILHDERIDSVVFLPLSVCPQTLTYTDLQAEDGFVWVNAACAGYYGKTSVIVKKPD